MLRRPRTLRLNRLPGSASQQGGPCISSSTTLALEARNLKARVSAPLRLKGLHREGHTLAWARTGGGGALSSQWALPLSSLPPGRLVCHTLAPALGSVAVFFPKGNLDAVGQTDLFQATGEYRVMLHSQGSILFLHLTS